MAGPGLQRRARQAGGAAAWAAALILLAGCKTYPGYHGRERTILATYWGGGLSADLPAEFRVQAVVSAANQALRDRGYAVRTVRATEDSGTVEGEPRDAGILEAVVVDVELSADGTRVTVRVKPFGDEARSRAILDAILNRLGL